MNYTMKDLIQKTVALLKQKVKENLEQINENQLKIKEILKQPTSAERTFNFEKHYEVNKNLLAENNDFINIQLTLINFLEKYKNSNLFEEESESAIDVNSIKDEKELFDLTVKHLVPYNENHPKFDDKNFYGKLLKFYQEHELYEKCQELINLKGLISK